MSLRILFADDSVTAQNMGKKILTEAGYDVVAVSNGAAAVKKIAEQKPDIIILDVYMPGYSGLEVCEKVRGSMDTLKTPVLLTVGKLEPYKPEEVNRVRADGVIIKPFEASDLLAIIKKFEERIGQAAPPPLVRKPAVVERVAEVPEPPEPAIQATTHQPVVEVPDHMATASAFSDLLGTDPSGSMSQFDLGHAPSAPEPPPAPRTVTADVPRMPEYEVAVSWRDRLEEQENAEPVIKTPPPPVPSIAVARETGPTLVEPPAKTHPPQIPVYQESREPELEIVPTAVGPLGDIEIPREPALQESAAETTRATVADSRDPGLMPTLHHDLEPVSPAAREAAELAPVDPEFVAPVPPPPKPHVAPVPPPPPPVVVEAPVELPVPAPVGSAHGLEGPESDFEARVAAAMAAYSHVPEPPMGPEVSAEIVPEPMHSGGAEKAPLVVESATPEIPDSFDRHSVVEAYEPAPTFEYHPPVGRFIEADTLEPIESASIHIAHEPAPLAAGRESTNEHEQTFAAHIEAALPEAAVAAGAETGADHETIAQAIHRVMERLKPELVEEIVRELRSKK